MRGPTKEPIAPSGINDKPDAPARLLGDEKEATVTAGLNIKPNDACKKKIYHKFAIRTLIML
jgi:hypothetical protein